MHAEISRRLLTLLYSLSQVLFSWQFIQLRPSSFNRDGGLMLSRSWQPLLKQLRTATSKK